MRNGKIFKRLTGCYHEQYSIFLPGIPSLQDAFESAFMVNTHNFQFPPSLQNSELPLEGAMHPASCFPSRLILLLDAILSDSVVLSNRLYEQGLKFTNNEPIK
jgi:hypothetical protein